LKPYSHAAVIAPIRYFRVSHDAAPLKHDKYFASIDEHLLFPRLS